MRTFKETMKDLFYMFSILLGICGIFCGLVLLMADVEPNTPYDTWYGFLLLKCFGITVFMWSMWLIGRVHQESQKKMNN